MTVTLDDSAGTAQAISNDVTSLSINMSSAQQDVTGVNSSAHERINLLADLAITFQGVFNDAATFSHVVFKDYRTNAGVELGRTLAIVHSGQTLSEAALLLTAYNLSRGAGGELTWEVPGVLADGSVPAWS